MWYKNYLFHLLMQNGQICKKEPFFAVKKKLSEWDGKFLDEIHPSNFVPCIKVYIHIWFIHGMSNDKALRKWPSTCSGGWLPPPWRMTSASASPKAFPARSIALSAIHPGLSRRLSGRIVLQRYYFLRADVNLRSWLRSPNACPSTQLPSVPMESALAPATPPLKSGNDST